MVLTKGVLNDSIKMQLDIGASLIRVYGVVRDRVLFVLLPSNNSSMKYSREMVANRSILHSISPLEGTEYY